MIIIDIEMPKTCMECPILYDMMCCGITGSPIWRPNMTGDKLNNCPLHEIKSGEFIKEDKNDSND